MKKNWYRKSLVLGLLFLLVLPWIVPTISGTDGDFFYVDDDNTMGPWDGSFDHPFQFIQDAIDAASNGDTIFVFTGIYLENVNVNKSINLFGENKNSTVIDGGGIGDTIFISADSVAITGFNIQNSGDDFHQRWDSGIELSNVGHVTISDNIIFNNYVGIFLYHCTYCIIFDNIVSSTLESWDGIYLKYSCNIRISRNIITSLEETGRDGIYLSDSSSNTIHENIVSSNDNGIRLYRSHDTTISGNAVTSNRLFGINIQYCANNKISENIISNNTEGIYFEYPPEYSTNYISRNNFLDNKLPAYFLTYYSGILIWSENYWSRGMILPKTIIGISRPSDKILFIPKFQFVQFQLFVPWFYWDWNPAKKPYNIPTITQSSSKIEEIKTLTDLYLYARNKITSDDAKIKHFSGYNNSLTGITTKSSLSVNSNKYSDDLPTNNVSLPTDLEPGDLVFMDCKQYSQYFSRPGNHTDHVAMYIGFNEYTNEHEFAETIPSLGVRICNFSALESWAHNFAFARVATATEKQRQTAANWVRNQCLERNKPVLDNGDREIDNYQYHPPLGYWKSYKPDGFDIFSNFWYCSELVWAAYYSVDKDGRIDYNLKYKDRIDIDRSGWLPPWVVNPEEILYDNDVIRIDINETSNLNV